MIYVVLGVSGDYHPVRWLVNYYNDKIQAEKFALEVNSIVKDLDYGQHHPLDRNFIFYAQRGNTEYFVQELKEGSST